jgi:hypothetical protein
MWASQFMINEAILSLYLCNDPEFTLIYLRLPRFSHDSRLLTTCAASVLINKSGASQIICRLFWLDGCLFDPEAQNSVPDHPCLKSNSGDMCIYIVFIVSYINISSDVCN